MTSICGESMAINLYPHASMRGAAGLWPDTIENEARALQWSFWVMTEVESALLSVLMHSRVLPQDKAGRSESCLGETAACWHGVRGVDKTLATIEVLAGDRFTVADLTYGGVFMVQTGAPAAERPRPSGCMAEPASAGARPHSSPESRNDRQLSPGRDLKNLRIWPPGMLTPW